MSITAIRARLSDERGTALIDAMVGVFILGIATTALVFAVTSISAATSRVADVSAQETALRSAQSVIAAAPSSVATTASTEDFVSPARTVAVTRVQIDNGDGLSTIRVITGKTSSDDCADINAVAPTAADYDRCLIFDRQIVTAAEETN
tara:strand:- start:19 stop:465 length:447 start_codon:yes stop_codon:yes gene_type:complete